MSTIRVDSSWKFRPTINNCLVLSSDVTGFVLNLNDLRKGSLDGSIFVSGFCYPTWKSNESSIQLSYQIANRTTSLVKIKQYSLDLAPYISGEFSKESLDLRTYSFTIPWDICKQYI